MEEKILRLTKEGFEEGWAATFNGWFLLAGVAGARSVRDEMEFLLALVARCAGDGNIPNNGEGVAAGIARAYLASRGVETLLLEDRIVWKLPGWAPVFLWAAVWRFAGKGSSGTDSPLATLLRLLKPEWKTGGGDSSCVTNAEEIAEIWLPATEAGMQSSPIRKGARRAGLEAYARLPIEYKIFVDALAPFGPAAFKKVLEKGGGW